MKNNNKATNIEVANESDDDDSVFINENKPKKVNKTSAKHNSDAKSNVHPATCDASSVMLNVPVPNGKLAAKNLSSRDLTVKSETVVR